MNYNKELAFYNSFHKNIINKLLHVIGIPMIVWSTFLLTHRIKILKIKLSSILYFAYMIKYYNINKLMAIKTSIFYAIIFIHSHNIYKKYPKKYTLKLASYFQIFSWLLQFYGHKIYEKNRPALLKGFTQSLTMAPMFVVQHIDSFIDTTINRF